MEEKQCCQLWKIFTSGSKLECNHVLENSNPYRTTILKDQINRVGNTEEKGEGTQIGSSIGFSE